MPKYQGYHDDRPGAAAKKNQGMSVPGAKGFRGVGGAPWNKGSDARPKAEANRGGKGPGSTKK